MEVARAGVADDNPAKQARPGNVVWEAGWYREGYDDLASVWRRGFLVKDV